MIKTINDLTLTTEVLGDMQLEIDLGGTSSQKVKVDQLKDFIYTGESLANLQDVELVDVQDNDVLQYDFNNELWRNVQLPEVTLELSALNDVLLTSPSNNEFLTYDGVLSKWINATLPDPVTSLAELTDVELDNLQNNQYLRYNAGDQVWENQDLPSIPEELEDLNNVSILNPVDGEYLRYNANLQEWENNALPFIPEQLEDLNNVTVNNLQNDDILRYNTSESRWENKVLLQPLLNDLQDVHLSSLQNTQALIYNSTALQWQNQTLPDVSVQNAVHVSKNGNDTTGNGSLSKPFLTIQHAINSVSSVRTILVGPGEYNENLTFNNKSNITVSGISAPFESPNVVITGHISITGTSIRIKLVNLNLQGSTAGTPTLHDNSSAGRHFLTNVPIAHSDASTPGLRITSGENTFQCDNTTIDKVELVGTPSSQRRVAFLNSSVGLVTITSPLYICQAGRCNVFGPVVHQAGVLAMSEVSLVANLSLPALTSTVNLGFGAVYLIGVNYQQDDGSYLAINKTGTCPYLIAYCNRNPAIDTLNGTRISFGMPSQDIGANYTPVNYTPSDGSLRAHLEAIDNKLGLLEQEVGTTLALA